MVWTGHTLLGGGMRKVKGEQKTTSIIEDYEPLTDTWITWEEHLPAPLAFHKLFNCPGGI